MRAPRRLLLALSAAALLALGSNTVHAAGGTGGGGTGGGGGGGGTKSGLDAPTGGGGGGKAVCTVISGFTADGAYRPGSMDITATYGLNACAPRNRISITMTNLATGVVEFVSPVDFPGNSITYPTPDFATNYRVDLTVTALNTGLTIGSRSISLTTPAVAPNCATVSNYNLSAGYWVSWAAIWTQYAVLDCGYGRERVEFKVTNLDSGRVELDIPDASMNIMYDYEGSMVSYSTNYQIEVLVRGAAGELLDSHSETIATPAMK